MVIDFEFYESPEPFTQWLFQEVPIRGVIVEPCVGDGAIVTASNQLPAANERCWVINDLDPRWSAEYHRDATEAGLWTMVNAHHGPIDWTITNPPFTPAIEIITHALTYSRIGVAMHLRASIHEVLKTGVRRTWMAEHQPTGILWLPRFAYQRSKTTGKWTTDSVCACWVVWLKNPQAPQFIRYAPEWVIDALDAFTPEYRKRMDAIMNTRTEMVLA